MQGVVLATRWHLQTTTYMFLDNLFGIVFRPYETYRRIVDHGQWHELIPISLVVSGYFALASLIKVARFRPFVLTRQFLVLEFAAAATFFLVVGLLWWVGSKLGGKGEPRGLILAWGYTLIPTTLWFLATSILYVVFPPPRTTQFSGMLLSASFLGLSTTIFLWKIVLSYLTLRFSLKLSLGRIILVWGLVLPFLGAYSLFMYKLGIFRVPFI